MYCGGDYVGAVVADVGSGTIKYGQYGRDTPDAIVPSYLIQLGEEFYLLFYQNGVFNVADPSATVGRLVWGSSGIQFDAQSVCKTLDLIDSNLSPRYSVNSNSHSSDLSTTPIMLCEPNSNTKIYRETFSEVLFEGYGCPGLYFSKSAVLSAFSSGRLTALVIDLGSRVNSLSAVYNGRLLTENSVVESCVSGNFLDFCFAKMVLSGECGDLLSSNLISQGFDSAILSNCNNNLTDLRNVYAHEVVRDLRENLCGISQIKHSYNSVVEGLNLKKISAITHTLPDGTTIDAGNLAYAVGELLFTTNVELMREYGVKEPDTSYKGLHTQVVDFVNGKVDEMYRKDLIANVFITGGLTCTTGLHDRLVNEMSSFIPNDENVATWSKLKITSPPRAGERSFSGWLGGSILASMPSFNNLWISRQEYAEHGPVITRLKEI